MFDSEKPPKGAAISFSRQLLKIYPTVPQKNQVEVRDKSRHVSRQATKQMKQKKGKGEVFQIFEFGRMRPFLEEDRQAYYKVKNPEGSTRINHITDKNSKIGSHSTTLEFLATMADTILGREGQVEHCLLSVLSICVASWGVHAAVQWF